MNKKSFIIGFIFTCIAIISICVIQLRSGNVISYSSSNRSDLKSSNVKPAINLVDDSGNIELSTAENLVEGDITEVLSVASTGRQKRIANIGSKAGNGSLDISSTLSNLGVDKSKVVTYNTYLSNTTAYKDYSIIFFVVSNSHIVARGSTGSDNTCNQNSTIYPTFSYSNGSITASNCSFSWSNSYCQVKKAENVITWSAILIY